MQKSQLESTSATLADESPRSRTASIWGRAAQVGVISAVLPAVGLAAFSLILATSDDLLHASFTNAVEDGAQVHSVFGAADQGDNPGLKRAIATNSTAASEENWLNNAGQSQHAQIRRVAWAGSLSLGDEVSVTIRGTKHTLSVVDVQQLPLSLQLTNDKATQKDQPASPIVMVTGSETTSDGRIRLVRFFMDADSLARTNKTRRIDQAL